MRRMALVTILSGFFAATAVLAVDVTTCGQVVPPNRVGHLAADLDCASGPGVTLGDNAKLKLHGHVLAGSADDANVVCAGLRCAIIGPGELAGGYYAVTGLSDLKAIGLTVRDQVRGGLDGQLSVRARRMILTGIGFGHTTPSLTETIRTGKLDATALWAHANGGSISATNYVLRRSTIESNGGVGIGGAGPLRRIIHSSVLGNLGGPLGAPVDVLGPTAPAMIDAACTHSWNPTTSQPLGICSDD